ncbi:hypothetical protein CLU79DRAFT_843960 [Phycomyces nitens]|nr:hypothetical protein CLU79DRAFT_843960 [Phycomyces nitens]
MPGPCEKPLNKTILIKRHKKDLTVILTQEDLVQKADDVFAASEQLEVGLFITDFKKVVKDKLRVDFLKFSHEKNQTELLNMPERQQPIIEEYLKGMHWCMAYFHSNILSWNWYYFYNRTTPSIYQMASIKEYKTPTFNVGEPMNLQRYLLRVLPTQQKCNGKASSSTESPYTLREPEVNRYEKDLNTINVQSMYSHKTYSLSNRRIIPKEGYEEIMLLPKDGILIKDFMHPDKDKTNSEISNAPTANATLTSGFKYVFVHGSTMFGNWVYDTLSHGVRGGLTVRMNIPLDLHCYMEPLIQFADLNPEDSTIVFMSEDAVAKRLNVHKEAVKHISRDFYVGNSSDMIINIGLQLEDNDGYTYMLDQDECFYFEEVLTLELTKKTVDRTKKANSENPFRTITYNVSQDAIMSLEEFTKTHGTKEFMLGDRCVYMDLSEQNEHLFGKKGTVIGIHDNENIKFKFDDDIFRSNDHIGAVLSTRNLLHIS